MDCSGGGQAEGRLSDLEAGVRCLAEKQRSTYARQKREIRQAQSTKRGKTSWAEGKTLQTCILIARDTDEEKLQSSANPLSRSIVTEGRTCGGAPVWERLELIISYRSLL